MSPDAGTPPPYVAFGSVAAHALKDIARAGETRARARAVAGAVRTDGATAAAKPLLGQAAVKRSGSAAFQSAAQDSGGSISNWPGVSHS